MRRSPASKSRVSLLDFRRRSPDDPSAWEEFVRHHGPMILAWCKQWRLQEADAQDVAQIVLTRLAVGFRDFRYDPAQSFRGWLWTVTHNACQTYLKGQQRPGQGAGDSAVFEQLHSVEARDDLARRLEEAFDQELLQQAMDRVRLRVEPRTWEAFR